MLNSKAIGSGKPSFATMNLKVTWMKFGLVVFFYNWVDNIVPGKLGDLYGHRRMYLLGFTGAAVLSFVTAAAPNAAFLIGARILAQAFSSSTGPSALAIMMKAFPDDQRTSVAGVWSAVLAASPRKSSSTTRRPASTDHRSSTAMDFTRSPGRR